MENKLKEIQVTGDFFEGTYKPKRKNDNGITFLKKIKKAHESAVKLTGKQLYLKIKVINH